MSEEYIMAITPRLAFDLDKLEEVCEVKGITPWTVNEGLIGEYDWIYFSRYEAERAGLIERITR